MKNIIIVFCIISLFSFAAQAQNQQPVNETFAELLSQNSYTKLDIGLIRIMAYWGANFNRPGFQFINLFNAYYDDAKKKISFQFTVNFNHPDYKMMRQKMSDKDLVNALATGDVVLALQMTFPDIKTDWTKIIRVETVDLDTQKTAGIFENNTIQILK